MKSLGFGDHIVEVLPEVHSQVPADRRAVVTKVIAISACLIFSPCIHGMMWQSFGVRAGGPHSQLILMGILFGQVQKHHPNGPIEAAQNSVTVLSD